MPSPKLKENASLVIRSARNLRNATRSNHLVKMSDEWIALDSALNNLDDAALLTYEEFVGDEISICGEIINKKEAGQ